jgi:hypothetical protein
VGVKSRRLIRNAAEAKRMIGADLTLLGTASVCACLAAFEVHPAIIILILVFPGFVAESLFLHQAISLLEEDRRAGKSVNLFFDSHELCGALMTKESWIQALTMLNRDVARGLRLWWASRALLVASLGAWLVSLLVWHGPWAS